MKRCMAVCLCVALVLALGCCAAGEEVRSGSCGANLTWRLAGGTLTVSGSGDMWDCNNSSGAPWAECRGQITAVRLEAGVLRIGAYAFAGCEALAQVALPAGLEQIGAFAFQGCTALCSLELPSGLHTVERGAFRGCGLTGMELPGSVSSLGEGTFQDCTQLSRLVLPLALTEIPQQLASGCASLQTVVMPELLCGIGASAFSRCGSLTELYLPASLSQVMAFALNGCPLQTVRYGGTETQRAQLSIAQGNDALSAAEWQYRALAVDPDDPALERLCLPGDTGEIGAEAFRGIGAQRVDVPQGVHSIGALAFADCACLRYLCLPGGEMTLAGDMLQGSPAAMLLCPAGSAAADWAEDHGVRWMEP